MVNENMSGWILEGQKKGIDLMSMHEDKDGMMEMIVALGLPYPRTHKFDGDQVNSPEIDRLFQGSSYFCRLVHKREIKRPYRLLLRTADEFRQFCSEHDMAEYKINLVEKEECVYSGAIVAEDESVCQPGLCIVELVDGTGEDLFHGKSIPLHSEVRDGRIMYGGNRDPSARKRVIVLRALKLIGGPKHPFPGYYEFDVWDGGRIMFRNYQSPHSAYGKLNNL